ncbi:MAG: DUF2927 domain-containing protein [Pseudomonadota bacterium]
MKRYVLSVCLLLIAACSSEETTRLDTPDIVLPPMKTFARTAPTPPRYSNAQLARDFLDLTFTLENGEAVPVFTRFEGPITVRVLGDAPQTLGPDLDRLLQRLRREAGLDISRVAANQDATITVEPMPRRQIRRVAPAAACFVRPNVSSWAEYRQRRSDPTTFWNRLSERRSMAVFLPNDVSPQEIRDCLHEEIAQGLGPVNDIFRLATSIFNDDNFHAVLTGYDMMMLRVTYDRQLRSGLSRQQVAQRVPGILARINPRGGAGDIAPPAVQLGAWNRTIAQAISPRGSDARKLAAARRAVGLAAAAGPTDTRLAFSYYVLGRQTLSSDPAAAMKAFLTAGTIYQNRRDSALQEAHVALQVAAFQLSAGQAAIAQQLIDQNLRTVQRAEHASLLSLMLLVKAEALELQSRPAEAAKIRRDALGYGRYGFGASSEVRERAAEILAISPRSRRTSEGPI